MIKCTIVELSAPNSVHETVLGDCTFPTVPVGVFKFKDVLLNIIGHRWEAMPHNEAHLFVACLKAEATVVPVEKPGLIDHKGARIVPIKQH